MKLLNILIFLLIFNTFILLGFAFSQLTGKVVYEKEIVNVTKVIDGDTIETEIGKIRLLGINTPEKKQPYYEEAKQFLIEFQGKQIELERTNEDKDKYERFLRYAFYGNKLINKEILENGLATLYYYSEDKYIGELKKAEESARKQGLGLWNKSVNYGCIKLVKLQYIEQERCHNQEQIILDNNCNSMQIIIKDDANHIYNLNLNAGTYTQNFSCIWNDEGDSLYVRDNNGLILFYRY